MGASIPGGYIIFPRVLLESEIWKNKPPLYLKIFLYILCKAQHKQYKNLKRGQAFIKIPEIMEECSYMVGYRVEKPTKKQVWGALNWLRNSNGGSNVDPDEGQLIVTTKVTHGMIVEVTNYDYYQNPQNYEGNKEEKTKETRKEQPKNREGNNNNKNGNNVNNDKNDILFVNNEKEIESDYINLCHKYYEVFAPGRWSKKQWKIMIQQFVSEIIKSKRFLEVKDGDAYVFKSLQRISESHDYANNKKRRSYAVNSKITAPPFYDWIDEYNNSQ